jgi:hypothetical protein
VCTVANKRVVVSKLEGHKNEQVPSSEGSIFLHGSYEGSRDKEVDLV